MLCGIMQAQHVGLTAVKPANLNQGNGRASKFEGGKGAGRGTSVLKLLNTSTLGAHPQQGNFIYP